MKTLSNEENDKATLPTVSRKPDEPSPAIEDSQLRSLTVPFARGSGTEYSSYLTFSFKAFTAYKFAVALKADDRNIGPANELPSAYFFTTAAPKAEPHVKLNQIADDAIQVTWSDPPPDQWHGTIQGYTVYVSEDKMCGRRTRTTRKGNSCKYSCLSPERVENKSLHRQGDLGEDWKFQQTDLLKAVYGSYDHSSTIGGLQPGRMYYVRVSMWNKHGEGPCDAVEKIWWTREFSAASVVGICAGVVAFLIFFGAIITKRNKIRRTWCPKIPMPDFAPSLIIFDGRESEKFLEVGKETIDLLKNYKSTHGLSENEPKADTPFVVRSTAFKMQKLENCDKMSDDGIALKDDLMTNEDDFVSALKKTYGDRCICGSVDTLDSEGYTSPENALRISANQQRRRAQSAKDSGLATCSSTLDGNE
uniref:Uncharacterized protein LOC100180191 n=1 Tax=Phallusia mammillata TaxID=59560 RepID=A0A6F9DI25_9ASCI|nr:uncharacterized protein LOC100180191 [Phallusia mammillata]